MAYKANEMMKKLFPKESKRREEGKCPGCGKPTTEADTKDELSRREYHMSGLCQACQDEVFYAKPGEL